MDQPSPVQSDYSGRIENSSQWENRKSSLATHPLADTLGMARVSTYRLFPLSVVVSRYLCFSKVVIASHLRERELIVKH